MNCDWLFDMSVKQPHRRALSNESCYLFQTLVWLRETNGSLDGKIDYSHTFLSVPLTKLQYHLDDLEYSA